MVKRTKLTKMYARRNPYSANGDFANDDRLTLLTTRRSLTRVGRGAFVELVEPEVP